MGAVDAVVAVVVAKESWLGDSVGRGFDSCISMSLLLLSPLLRSEAIGSMSI